MGHLSEAHPLRLIYLRHALLYDDLGQSCCRWRLRILREDHMLVLLDLYSLFLLGRRVHEQEAIHDVHALIFHNLGNLVQDHVVYLVIFVGRGRYLTLWHHLIVVKIDRSCCIGHPGLRWLEHCLWLLLQDRVLLMVGLFLLIGICPAHLGECIVAVSRSSTRFHPNRRLHIMKVHGHEADLVIV